MTIAASRARSRSQFPIPMRGNEVCAGWRVTVERVKFPIPMRGNESTSLPATAAQVRVPNPYEG